MTTHDNTGVLTALFQHNTWANLTLLDFCERLTDEQLDVTAVGGFGTIRETLEHIIGGEVSYVNRVNGMLPAQPLQREGFSGFAALKEAARWANHELLQLAIAAKPDTRVRQRPPRMLFEYSLTNLIAQALSHSTEHRTQIATIITQLGIEPPDLSGWNYMETSGDLLEIGPDQDPPAA